MKAASQFSNPSTRSTLTCACTNVTSVRMGGSCVYLEVASREQPDAVELQTLSDYHGYWLEKLARRHQHRPLDADARLISEAALLAWA